MMLALGTYNVPDCTIWSTNNNECLQAIGSGGGGGSYSSG